MDNSKVILRLVLENLNWPFIFIGGNRFTGKTCITREIVETIGALYSWTNCLEICSEIDLLKKILLDAYSVSKPLLPLSIPKYLSLEEFVYQFDALASDFFESNKCQALPIAVSSPAKAAKCKTIANCDSPRRSSRLPHRVIDPTLPRRAKTPIKILQQNKNVPKYYILLDNYENLGQKTFNPLIALNHLKQTCTNCNVTVVLISSENFDSFTHHFLPIPTPYQVTLPQPDEASFSRLILSLEDEEDLTGGDVRYTNHLHSLVKSMYASLYHPAKIREIVKALKQRKGENKPFLNNITEVEDKLINQILTGQKTQPSFNNLPLSTKYLLIACFIASYNTKANDKKILVLKSDKKRNTGPRKTALYSKNRNFFTLERLIHIYKAIIFLNTSEFHDELTNSSNSLSYKLHDLAKLGILKKRVSKLTPNLSSLTTYRISDYLTPDVVMKISKTINFEIKNYLAC